MSFDTSVENKKRNRIKPGQNIWLFGYGSLIYKVDFPYIQQQPAHITGWQRRFWQGSHDHRGTLESPGRVVTLIANKKSACFGVAFKVNYDVFEHLDRREKNGYLIHEVDIHFSSDEVSRGLTYIASSTNAAFLGPLPELEIARHIYQSSGPSGDNKDYVYKLAQALRELAEPDAHVFTIERYLKEMEQESS